jgi:ankyrin repeat protein
MHAIHAGRANSNLLKLVLGTEAGKASLANDLPVHYALLLGNTNLARQLIKLGADPEATDGKGRSAYDLVTDRSALKKLKAAHRQQATA